MSKLRYIVRVLKNASFKKLFAVIRKTHEKSGKNRALIFFDMLLCAVLYGAGYHDYLIFAFWDMKHFQRKTYLTRVVNKKLISLVNDPALTHIFDFKDEFNSHFAKYLKRDFLILRNASLDEFSRFFQEKSVVFAKPRVGESGKGIERLVFSECSDIPALFERLLNSGIAVAEEQIVQHPRMSKLYPYAVNSLRIVTFVTDGDAILVYAVCKMGNGGKFVDNMESDGLCCPIDINTGKICGIAHSAALINYSHHPQSGIQLIGYEIPFVSEAIELCKQAALEYPDFRYVGWDVAITEAGPLIIEGNDYPGYDFWQLPEHTPDKIGLKPFFKQFLPNL